MGEAGAEVAGGVDRVAGGAAEGEADGEDERADDQRVQALGEAVGPDRGEAEQEHEAAEGLAEEIGGGVAEGGGGAEDGEFRVWIIPHTFEVTNLREKKVGDALNLEADLVGKYVEQMLGKMDLGRR